MNDTIVAKATPPGRGGIGIVRISGPHTQRIAQRILGKLPKPRCAEYHAFQDEQSTPIDFGIALFFQAPHSFTGEDILELHGHGGPIVMDRLLRCILLKDSRLAKPGEFSQRAFLNDKIDLIQAESISDLISAQSEEAACAAIRSLQGVFSDKMNQLVNELIALRVHVEACIDFPEEDIEKLKNTPMEDKLRRLQNNVAQTKQAASQGALLQEGMSVVIAGVPNVGKSSLLNQLITREMAIVTPIPGTTRDVLREEIHIDGMPLHVIDTAGLRETDDLAEQEGVRRAWQEIEKADMILWVVDDDKIAHEWPVIQEKAKKRTKHIPITIVKNKIDLSGEVAEQCSFNGYRLIRLSAKTGDGVALLRDYLKEYMGYRPTEASVFLARRRHVIALDRAQQYIDNAIAMDQKRQWELLAEELRLAQNALSEITGDFTSDDLLGEIFSQFCIGK
ncbi:MAG: tRNA uridine-5-carboxymethylaminomethyl(34) synthesis GTPase MnmE [Gammaproteobacteria bacterium RIFCSPHIGHO2_12_FULL_41_15]|nr:MAG: tRNA uridine-5-carboxymethylaminomethyl(34) synthesis GTPase MnmE [Gammaproteobacteria bacterium RIFCSPHIGHO2_12_FULL_41_15]